MGDEAQTVGAARDHVCGPERRIRGLAEEHHVRLRTRGERTDPRVVRVQERDAVGRQGLDELGLSHRDRLDARRPRVMHRNIGDARDDADPRAHQGAEVSDLARYVEAHLDHRDFVARLDPEERERDADLIVERRQGAQDPVTRAERRGRRLLRGRLADISRDTNGRDGVRVAQGLGETPEGVLRVRNLHDERAVRQIGDGTLHDGRASAVRERVRHWSRRAKKTLPGSAMRESKAPPANRSSPFGAPWMTRPPVARSI